jgi:hypothetical protein
MNRYGTAPPGDLGADNTEAGRSKNESAGRQHLTSHLINFVNKGPVPRQPLRCPVCGRKNVACWGPFGDSRARCQPCGYTASRSEFIAGRAA